VGEKQPVPARPMPGDDAIAGAVDALRSGEPTVLLLGGRTLHDKSMRLAATIAAATGCKVLSEMFNARMERGQGRPPVERIPYFIDAALHSLEGIRHLILAEAKQPVSFFAYPGKPGKLWPEDCTLHTLAAMDQDGNAALAALAQAIGGTEPEIPITPRPAPATEAIAPETVATTIAALLPDHAIVIDEGISFGRGFSRFTHGAAPHLWLQVPGGAIGGGLPTSVGAAVGAPGRRVVSIQADGSAMYSIAALWTAARQNLDITVILLANRKYAILLNEFAGVGANPGPTALGMLNLGNPDLDFGKLAEGMGVAAAQAPTMARLNELLASSVNHKGPFLIELLTA
ncbi:MAG TPA: acetolactate synthase large subunit, partial [Acidiphilium sp.]